MDPLQYNDLVGLSEAQKERLLQRDAAIAELVEAKTHETKRLQKEVLKLQAEVAKLQEEKRLDRANRFGASSERGDHQYRLFDEAEAHADDEGETVDEPDTITVPAHTKRRPTRKPLPADMPRVVVEHEPDNTHCACGAALERIGTKVSEQLDVIPPQAFAVEHRRGTYKCPCCVDAVPVTAPMPPQPIPKSLASPGLLAHVAVSKYVDGLPLYRQSKMFARLDVAIPRQTLASHMVRVGSLVNPLVERLKQHLTGYDILHMDETRVQVLKAPDKLATSDSWMWVMRGGPPDRTGVVFHHASGRGGDVPMALLSDFAGYLHTDGYSGYGAVQRNSLITGLGCWAHARRYFIQAKKALPKGKVPSGRLLQALAFIDKLYAIERESANTDPESRYRARLERAGPILEEFEAWLTKQDVVPSGKLGQAITYVRNEWPRLIVYLQDGRLAIDNNAVENAIRPFAVGRKNWLFSDTPKGADASANLYSLVETAKANRINEYAYLKHVFTELPKATTGDIDHLLPWNVDRAALMQLLIPPTL